MASFNILTKTVASAGTAERLTTENIYVDWFIMEIIPANSGTNIYRGDSTVDNTGAIVKDGRPFSWAVQGHRFNLKDMWIDADISSDGVIVMYGLSEKDAYLND